MSVRTSLLHLRVNNDADHMVARFYYLSSSMLWFKCCKTNLRNLEIQNSKYIIVYFENIV